MNSHHPYRRGRQVATGEQLEFGWEDWTVFELPRSDKRAVCAQKPRLIV
jgi:hypothetical protein